MMYMCLINYIYTQFTKTLGDIHISKQENNDGHGACMPGHAVWQNGAAAAAAVLRTTCNASYENKTWDVS